MLIFFIDSADIGSKFKPEYLQVTFSSTRYEKNIDHNGGTIIGEGIRVSIPTKAVNRGDTIPVMVQACLGGPFEFPRDYDPISPVYLFLPPCAFQTAVQLDIQVFADVKKDDDIIFLTSLDKPSIVKKQQIWNFQQEAEDVSSKVLPFSDGCRVISVSVRHFCFGLLARFRRKSNL